MGSRRLRFGLLAAAMLSAGVWRFVAGGSHGTAADGRAESAEPGSEPGAAGQAPIGGVTPSGEPGASSARTASNAALRVTHRTRMEVERVLFEIELRARERGELTPEDVQEGMDAITELAPLLGRQQLQDRKREFGRRMSILTRQLRIAPLQEELSEMAARAKSVRNRDARARLVDEYRERASELPAIEEAAAIAQLERAVGPNARVD